MNSPDSLLIAEIDDVLELLRLRVLRFRHQLEIAEARVPRWNQLVQQFWQAGLLPQTAILGRVIETRPYAPAAMHLMDSLVIWSGRTGARSRNSRREC